MFFGELGQLVQARLLHRDPLAQVADGSVLEQRCEHHHEASAYASTVAEWP